MDDRISVKSDQQIVSTEVGLAATIGCASRQPIGGEMFFLTAPFIERCGVFRELSTEQVYSLHISCNRALQPRLAWLVQGPLDSQPKRPRKVAALPLPTAGWASNSFPRFRRKRLLHFSAASLLNVDFSRNR